MSTAALGQYFDGQTAHATEVRLSVDEHGVLHAEPSVFQPIALSKIRIDSPVGNVPRRLRLPDGGLIETDHHAAVEQWLASSDRPRNLVSRLERNLPFALTAAVLILVVTAAGIRWGLPWAGGFIAQRMPQNVVAHIGDKALETLDRIAFEPSQLSAQRKQELTQQFLAIVPQKLSANDYRLVFRDGTSMGPNAFALPDGTIVMTDQLATLAHKDEDLFGIWLHEIGHVLHRHTLRQLVAQAGLAAFIAAITGDVNSAGAMALALPGFLLESSFSRQMETEADDYAFVQMQAQGLSTGSFADIMQRMETCAFISIEDLTIEGEEDINLLRECFPLQATELISQMGDASTTQAAAAPEMQSAETEDGRREFGNRVLDFFTTHPPTPERIARFREADQGL